MNTEIIDITDCSGSMQCLQKSVIDGFNSFLQEQRSVVGAARITQVQFNENYYLVSEGKDINQAKPLDVMSYRPSGMTALLDAIGRTLEVQAKRIKEEGWADNVIVCIRTDGQENASSDFTNETVKAMVEHAQNHGWKFIFTAANQDAFHAAKQYGISPQYTRNFTASGQGVGQTYAETSLLVAQLRTPQTVAKK